MLSWFPITNLIVHGNFAILCRYASKCGPSNKKSPKMKRIVRLFNFDIRLRINSSCSSAVVNFERYLQIDLWPRCKSEVNITCISYYLLKAFVLTGVDEAGATPADLFPAFAASQISTSSLVNPSLYVILSAYFSSFSNWVPTGNSFVIS